MDVAVVFGVLLAFLVVHLGYVVARARSEWRAGAELSGTTALLITAIWALTAALLVAALAWRPLALPVLAGAAVAIGGVLVLGGIVLIAAGFRPFRSVGQLYGLAPGRLITGGVYAYSRHPQYTGIGLLLAGAATLGRCGLALAVAVAYWPAIRGWLVVEEEHLERTFGDEYREYRTRTARFVGLPHRPAERRGAWRGFALPLVVAGSVFAFGVASGYYDTGDTCLASPIANEGSLIYAEPQAWPPGTVRCRAVYPHQGRVLTDTVPDADVYVLYVAFAVAAGLVAAVARTALRRVR